MKIWRIIFFRKEMWTRKIVKEREGVEGLKWQIKLSTTDIAINQANIYFKSHFPQNSENLKFIMLEKKEIKFQKQYGAQEIFFNQ